MAMKPSHLAKRAQLDHYRAQGVDLLQEQGEIYREAFLATVRSLLGGIARCRNIASSQQFDTVLVQFAAGVAAMAGHQEIVLCGCADCTESLTTLRTHINSIAVIRGALDTFMTKLGKTQGKVIRRAPSA